MKVFNRYLPLMLLSSLMLAACSDNDFDYTPASAVEGEGFYFSSDNSTTVSLSSLETSFDVVVMRTYSGTATTAAITATDESGLFSIPSSVSFATDELSTTLTISYDPDALGYDTYSITLSLEETGQTTPYGMSTLELTVGVPEPWVAVTTGDYTYSLFFSGDDSGLTLYQNGTDPTRYKIEHWGYDVDFYFTYDESTGKVTVDYQETGYTHSSYGMVYVIDATDYTGSTDYGEGYYDNGTFYFAMFYIVDEDYFGYGYETFTLAGYSVSDYSLSLAYGGKYTNSSDEDEGVLAVLSDVGADAETIRLAVVEGRDYEAAVESVKSGNVSSTEVTAEAATVMVPFDGTPIDGYYTLVAVTYDGDGVAQDYAYVMFKYTSASSETWTAIATGSYWYTLFFVSNSDPYEDAGLVLYQSDNDPTRYKIEHWGYDVDYCFTYDESTGEVWVDDQEIGYEYGSYGMVYVVDYSTYVGDDEPTSYYDDDTNSFYFAQVYYVSAGYLTYGYEQFEITGAASAKSASKAKSSRKAFGEDLEAKKITPSWRLQKPKLNTLWNN